MKRVKLIEHAIPIFASKGNVEGSFSIDRLIGTCFSLGNGYLMTCKHVLEQAFEFESIGISNLTRNGENDETVYLHDKKSDEFILGENYEYFDETDLAIFQIKNIDFKTYAWYDQELFTFENVKSYGYPFSYDNEQMYVNPRGLKGHIVSCTPFHQFIKSIDVYELSFPCPRGISGAFLLNEDNYICGVIMGNSKIEIELYNTKEISSDGNKEHIFITSETETVK